MPLIVTGSPPPKKGEKTARGQRSSAALAAQAQAELDSIVKQVLSDMSKILPDWDTQSDSMAIVASLAQLQAKWQADIQAVSATVASKWVSAVDERSKSELVDSLRKTVGIGQARVVDTPGMRSMVTAMGREAAGLIRSIPGELLSGVAEAVEKAYNQEPLPEGRSLTEEIAFLSGHAKKRARFIAKDQTQKMHGVVTRTRQAELGIKEFIWRTMKDSRVVGTPGGLYPDGSRLHGNHYLREGKKYSWDKLPPDGGPGWGINCRCYAEPVIDMDSLDIISVSSPTMQEFDKAAPKPLVKASPEPFSGYKASQEKLLSALLEKEKAVMDAKIAMDADTTAAYTAGFKAVHAEATQSLRKIKADLSRLKAKGLKAAAAAKVVASTTSIPTSALPGKKKAMSIESEKKATKPASNPQKDTAQSNLKGALNMVPANPEAWGSAALTDLIMEVDNALLVAVKRGVDAALVSRGHAQLGRLRAAYNVVKAAEVAEAAAKKIQAAKDASATKVDIPVDKTPIGTKKQESAPAKVP